MIQQQAALPSFVEAWLMGLIFLGMLPLLLFLRKTRDLRPPAKKSKIRKRVALGQQPVPEPEMAGAFH